ncbi:hypothetical protein EDB80DRAFT_709251 [Ilyonectria destructans]|nr:hypothetical protein EDB80DRAFT_709251 [Ilyonectria destructans]
MSSQDQKKETDTSDPEVPIPSEADARHLRDIETLKASLRRYIIWMFIGNLFQFYSLGWFVYGNRWNGWSNAMLDDKIRVMNPFIALVWLGMLARYYRSL